MNDNDLPYRPCVGIALFNDKKQLFVGERLDNPGAWQMPQGGIDEGETAEQAFFREMKEEVGTDKAKILKILDEPLRYRLPPHLMGKLWGGRWGGQEQTWIAARFTGIDADIDIYAHNPPEFNRWKWAAPEDMLKLIVSFKKETYRQVLEAFKEFIV